MTANTQFLARQCLFNDCTPPVKSLVYNTVCVSVTAKQYFFYVENGERHWIRFPNMELHNKMQLIISLFGQLEAAFRASS